MDMKSILKMALVAAAVIFISNKVAPVGKILGKSA